MNAATAFGTVLVDELVRCGLREAVVSPGSRSAPLALALAADERVRLHVRHDERSAAFLAIGLARGGGRGTPALVVCTSGGAVGNLHPGVIEADRAGVGVLLATADRPPELRGTGANQTIDQVHVFGRSVRWFAEVGVPEGRDGEPSYWRSVAARAWAEATGSLGGAPGPVHLNCALREPLVDEPGAAPVPRDLGGRPDGEPWTLAALPPSAPAGQGVGMVMSAVEDHERGVIVVGDGELDEPWLAADLAAATGWPVLAEPQSGARRGRHAVSAYDALLRHEAFADGHRPDVALVLGKPGLSGALLRWLAEVRQILILPTGRHADPTRAASEVVAGDAGELLTDLLARLGPRGRGDTGWTRAWLDAQDAADEAINAVLDDQELPSEPRLARDLGTLLPGGSVLTVASSMPIRDLDAFLRPREGLRIVANRGASGIDGFVSTAVGVALSHGGPATALAGDLSLLHDQNGLLIPPGDPQVDLVLVVVNNDGGAIFSLLPQAGHPEHFERVFGTPHGLDLARLAHLHSGGHARLERAGDLEALLVEARAAGGLQLVEVRTDRTANADLHRRLLDAVARAVG